MDTEKQRQCRRDDARLTASGNARSGGQKGKRKIEGSRVCHE